MSNVPQTIERPSIEKADEKLKRLYKIEVMKKLKREQRPKKKIKSIKKGSISITHDEQESLETVSVEEDDPEEAEKNKRQLEVFIDDMEYMKLFGTKGS